MDNELQVMPGVQWVVAEDSANVSAQKPIKVPPRQIDTLQLQVQQDAIPEFSSWAKHMLAGSLALAVVWLAGLAIIIIGEALFIDAVVRGAWAIGWLPIITMLAIALFADPYRNVGDEIYRAFNPIPPCTPNRNTLTGRDQ